MDQFPRPLGYLNICEVCFFLSSRKWKPRKLRQDGQVYRKCNYCKKQRMVFMFEFDLHWIQTSNVRST